MKILTNNNHTVAVIDQEAHINGTQDILDLIVSAQYNGCIGMIISKKCLPENFFDLKTGFAGEVLQKFSNYRFKVAIVGDFSCYPSKSLQDFIYECNKGSLVYFKDSVDSAIHALTPGE